MAKSKIARESKSLKHLHNSQNVVPLNLTIPYKTHGLRKPMQSDISRLLHLGCNKENKKIDNRTVFIRRFCEKANQYDNNGKSVETIVGLYENLRAYIFFCDGVNVDPFTKGGYLKFAGNDGELRHRIKAFSTSKHLWKYNHGDELGIKEKSAVNMLSYIRKALYWCGLPTSDWALHHRGFSGESTPYQGYSEEEEKLLVTRLSNLFFTLAPQLIAAKENNTPLPENLPIMITLGMHEEIVHIPTSLDPKQAHMDKDGTNVNKGAAFNLTMGAAYHLMCYFTSLNDSNILSVAHPIEVHIEDRDKRSQIVKISSYKPRANKKIDALLIGEQFSVNKRDGVKFITLLEKLSKLYGNAGDGSELLFTLDNNANVCARFEIKAINQRLVNQLHLVSPYRTNSLPWFKELFYTYRNQQKITLRKVTNHLGRTVIHKEKQAMGKTGATRGATNSAYCILSCYTDLPLKGILLPLTYSEKDSDGNITISFFYRNGTGGLFKIPASDLTLIKDIEQYANENADKQPKKCERLLLAQYNGAVCKDWKDISPISSSLMKTWSVDTNHFYISLQSSRWRKMTSNQAYGEGGIQNVQSLLQNTIKTLETNYLNGHPLLNKVILSQGLKVLQNLDTEANLDKAKTIVANKLGIPMLSYDEYKKKHSEGNFKTNPNGLICNGKQATRRGKHTHRVTNHALEINLPCVEFDMCYKCQSAKAVDDIEAIYKLISHIDVLKDALDMYPDAKSDIHEKIEQFEYTLDGASKNVFERAMEQFMSKGRHPRVSINHALLSL